MMHDFNAREWDSIGSGIVQKGRSKSRELKRVPCVLLIGNVPSENEVGGGQNSYHECRTGNKGRIGVGW